MKAVAFGVLCGDYDQDCPRKPSEWVLQPSTRLVALLAAKKRLQAEDLIEASVIQSILLGYEPRFEQRRKELETMVADKWSRDALNRVSFRAFQYEDPEGGPHDYDACHQVLLAMLEQFIRKEQPALIFLHANSGTFVQQMHLYRYADRQLLSCPARMLVTTASPAPGVEHAVPRLGLSRKSTKSLIRAKDFTAAQDRILERFGRANDTFESEILPLLVRIGVFSNDTILLTGETGTGKSFLAYILHEAWLEGRRNVLKPDRSFHVVNCGGMDSTFLYTEIFGAKAGAYTGAMKDRPGKMRLADDGTLFLDEIGDLDARAQAMLLKAIEEKEFYALGSDEPSQSGFRLLCATNRNLRTDVAEGKFRQDLYARISGWEFRLPSLHEREDHPKIVRDILDKWHAENRDNYQDHFRLGVGALPNALARLHTFLKTSARSLRGNHRELQQIVARIATRSILNDEEEITLETVNAELALFKTAAESARGDIEASLFETVIEAAISGEHREHIPPAHAVELWLIEQAHKRFGIKAAAGKYLYHDRHPTQKIRDRQEYLLKRTAQGTRVKH